MNIQENVDLLPYNTFGLSYFTKYFSEVSSLEDIKNVLNFACERKLDLLILGGGSNILLTKDFDGLAIKVCLQGKEIIEENEEHVIVKASAGELWHSLVLFCVENGWGGIENLSLIPGCVGAAPMQNIGAYGVELKDVFVSLEAFNKKTGVVESFDRNACDFGYRWSYFKGAGKDKYIILNVTLSLAKKPTVNIHYGAIMETLSLQGITQPTIKDVSNAVIAIRSSKLPDPKKIGNAGSFFKNPEIPANIALQLKEIHPNMPTYPGQNGLTKIPAGWLIEQCGWKGKIIGQTGCHKDQALVIVNYGHATGVEIVEHAHQVQRSVKEKFGIEIEPEVNLV